MTPKDTPEFVLKSLQEYILERTAYWKSRKTGETSNSWRIQHSMECEKRTQLSQLMLKPEIFIPFKDGEPLEKPKDYVDFLVLLKEDKIGVHEKDWYAECKEYQKALDIVLIKECEYSMFREGRSDKVEIIQIGEFVIMARKEGPGWGHNGIWDMEDLIRQVNRHDMTTLIPTESCIKKYELSQPAT